MKGNLGWFTRKGFVAGLLLCLSLGVLIYRQFDFTQRAQPDDVATSRIKELEKELNFTRSKVDALEQRLHELDAKLTTLSTAGVKANKKP
jgi:uncharacterized protein YlxW (UPF0749 family)